MRAWLPTLLCLMGLACRQAPTQLLATVDSDITTLQSVFVSVAREDGSLRQTQCWAIGTGPAHVPLPFSFGIARPDGPTTPGRSGPTVRVEVSALERGCPESGERIDGIVTQSAITGFVDHTTLRLAFFLSEACAARSCSDGETCRQGTCTNEFIDPSDLTPTIPGTELDAAATEHDAGPNDANSDPVDVGIEDGGPGDARGDTNDDVLPAPQLTFPWNGHSTGSVHSPRAREVEFRWRSVTGAVRYRLEVDTDCLGPGEAPESCDFDNALAVDAPSSMYTHIFENLSMDAPVGARVVWRVRACSADECGRPADPRYLNVGRVRSDINGDGYTDTVASEFGGFRTLFGASGADGFMQVLDGALMEGGHGNGLAVGDINGDGFADIAAGEPATGKVYVLFGRADAAERTFVLSNAEVIDQGELVDIGGFGHAVAIGDWDGDGRSEVAIGRPLQDVGGAPKRVSVMDVDPNGPRVVQLDQEFIWDGPQESPLLLGFGAALDLLSDLNGDGNVDLVVGDPLRSSEAGAVLVYDHSATEVCRFRGDPGSQLGWAVATRISANLTPEIAAGAPLGNHVRFFDCAQRMMTQTQPGPQGTARFGQSLTAADVNGDRIHEVVVGATDSAHLVGPTDIPLMPSADSFGTGVWAGDLNGDSFDEVRVSAPSASKMYTFISRGVWDDLRAPAAEPILRVGDLGRTIAR